MPSIKIEKETDDGSLGSAPVREGHYPYGTSLHLDDELYEGIGGNGLSVGQVLKIEGAVVVTSKAERTEMDGDGSNSISLQFTEMSVYPKSESEDRAEVMYGKE